MVIELLDSELMKLLEQDANQPSEKLADQLSVFIETLSSREEVKFLCATSGRFDVIAIMVFASTEQPFEFLKKDIGKIEGLKTTETFICLHVEKNL